MLLPVGRFPVKGKYVDIIAHELFGMLCYFAITTNLAFLFLIFTLVEILQVLISRRRFGFDDIWYSMLAVSILCLVLNYVKFV